MHRLGTQTVRQPEVQQLRPKTLMASIARQRVMTVYSLFFIKLSTFCVLIFV